AYDSYPNYYSPEDLHHSTAGTWTPPLHDDNSLPNGDSCSTPALMQPWVGGGHFTWHIPAKWRVGDAGEATDLSSWSEQVFSMDSNGTVTISKFNQTVTRTTNNVTTPSL